MYIKLSSTIMTRRHALHDEQWEKIKGLWANGIKSLNY